MSEALYERYKDALRRGHVASLRGRHDVALAAYVEAATIAPERALPHASIGSVYLRLGRPGEALSAFDSALERAPADESAMAGRADALVALGRPAEAAVALDRLSSIQDKAGRSVDALGSARRALELAEARPRRHVVEALVERLRGTVSEAQGRASLAEALQFLERTSVIGPGVEAPHAPPPSDTLGPSVDVGATSAAGVAGPEAGAGAPEPEPEGEPAPDGGLGPELEPDALVVLSAAIAAVDSGDAEAGKAGLLRAAVLLDQSGRPDAAVDACYEALALAPGDPDLHLALADLYLDRGWGALAAEKLGLLGRLAELAGDEATAGRVRDVARARAPDEPRVRELLG